MATNYIHKKYFAVPYNANALTKMHVRQSNARNFEVVENEAENSASTEPYPLSDFILFALLPAAFTGAFLSEVLQRIFR